MIKKTRLATAGFAFDHDNATASGASAQDESIESLQLGISSQQHGPDTNDMNWQTNMDSPDATTIGRCHQLDPNLRRIGIWVT